jgi:hypothetical protein
MLITIINNIFIYIIVVEVVDNWWKTRKISDNKGFFGEIGWWITGGKLEKYRIIKAFLIKML